MNPSTNQSRSEPTIIPRADHGISRSDISESALKVLYRLKKSGYQAFIVGGGVRDILLGQHPKDFDVVTDASPDEVRSLFRNSRLIGRRFRLAHVRFGREIIEVATFRAAGDAESIEDDREHHAESGRILRDNVYGTIEDDIWRRDFTINALYYNIADFSVWDFTNGMVDIESQTLRLIGDPETRFREDPVRMLRAIRFAAKLGFNIHPDTGSIIPDLAPLLADVPSARLFEEVLKLFQSGRAVETFQLLEEYGLFKYLFPATAERLSSSEGASARELIMRGLRDTDERVATNKPITPMFLYAVLLWPAIQREARRLVASDGYPEGAAMTEACYRIVGAQQASTSLPKRFSVPMREILQMQYRFQNRKGARAARFLEHKRFRAAYDFMVLRANCGEIDEETATWWTEIQAKNPTDIQQAFGVGQRKNSSRRGGRRRRNRQPAREPAN